MQKNKYAFTFIELLISITILSILGSIGFIVLSSYLVTVRDSTRLVELENIESSLGSYVLRNGKYPEPTNGQNIIYSGSTVWTQGTFGNSVSFEIGYSKDVVDPLTRNEYTYSIKNTKKEYSIAGVFEERPGLVYKDLPIDTANASKVGETKGIALVKGNYNGELVTTQLNGITNILALPSIISSDLSSLDLQNIIDNNRLVYDKYNNLPASYSGSIFKLDYGIDFSANDLIIFSGSISELKSSYNQIVFLQDLYSAYSGTILSKNLLNNNLSNNKVDSIDLFSPEPSLKIRTQACDVVNFKLKYFVECGGVDFITFFVINVLHIDISNLPGSKITTVYQDSAGSFVFGTDGGLAIYNGTNWIVYYKSSNKLLSNKITAITQDNSGNYWIGTDYGISKLTIGDFSNKSDDIWLNIGKHDIVNTHVQYIHTDFNGVVWIGTHKGITSYNGNVWTDYTKRSVGLTNQDITSIYNDSNGNVWFGTDKKGVDKYIISDDDIVNYNSGKLPNKEVTYIFEDTTHKIWVGTEGGIGVTSNFGNTWTQYTNSNTSGGLISNDIKYLFGDSHGNIWIGTTSGVSKFNGSTWTKYSTTNSPNAPKYLLGNKVYLINEDGDGNIIIFSDGGLDTIDSSGNIIT